ncbi:putative inactive deoxyuridine 5'-triphosphate nucleotidohydrolase-like protein FLJ16323, partial [Pongo abelii]|uniref:putative inactive deoxyuridine 5'-triphosphate nucleotidohydrolase-like protein FLJ16323 n=1 Tax=Pongo abelii TaxID=9601 RepID=UPI00300505C1
MWVIHSSIPSSKRSGIYVIGLEQVVKAQGWRKIVQKGVYALNQHPIYGTVSPIARIHRSKNQGVEVEVTPLTITPSNPLAKFLLPVPKTLYSAGPEVFIPQGEVLPPGDTTTIPLNWMLKSPPGYFGLLLLLSQQAKNGVTVLAGVTDPEYQDEISLLLHNEGHPKEVKMEGAHLGLPGRDESLEHQVQSHLNMIAQSQRTFQKKDVQKAIILSKLTQEQKTKHCMF